MPSSLGKVVIAFGSKNTFFLIHKLVQCSVVKNLQPYSYKRVVWLHSLRSHKTMSVFLLFKKKYVPFCRSVGNTEGKMWF